MGCSYKVSCSGDRRVLHLDNLGTLFSQESHENYSIPQGPRPVVAKPGLWLNYGGGGSQSSVDLTFSAKTMKDSLLTWNSLRPFLRKLTLGLSSLVSLEVFRLDRARPCAGYKQVLPRPGAGTLDHIMHQRAFSKHLVNGLHVHVLYHGKNSFRETHNASWILNISGRHIQTSILTYSYPCLLGDPH